MTFPNTGKTNIQLGSMLPAQLSDQEILSKVLQRRTEKENNNKTMTTTTTEVARRAVSQRLARLLPSRLRYSTDEHDQVRITATSREDSPWRWRPPQFHAWKEMKTKSLCTTQSVTRSLLCPPYASDHCYFSNNSSHALPFLTVWETPNGTQFLPAPRPEQTPASLDFFPH